MGAQVIGATLLALLFALLASGIWAATAATIGRMSVPELTKRCYPKG